MNPTNASWWIVHLGFEKRAQLKNPPTHVDGIA
jgi:hypothetical protein